MGAPGIYEFLKWYYPQIRKEGLVVDVRSNGGGNVSQWIIERLDPSCSAPASGAWRARADTYPGTVFHGHLAVPAQRDLGLGRRHLPRAFRKAGLGPADRQALLGRRRRHLGPRAAPRRRQVFVPAAATNDVDGQLHHRRARRRPRHRGRERPASVLAGRDPQLERGVEVAARSATRSAAVRSAGEDQAGPRCRWRSASRAGRLQCHRPRGTRPSAGRSCCCCSHGRGPSRTRGRRRLPMNKLTLEDLPLDGRKALVRVDFNVPRRAAVTDDARIEAALPTIRYAVDQGAAVILASHLGRPKGAPEPKYAWRPVPPRPGAALSAVRSASPRTAWREAADRAPGANGEVLLLENLRFHPGEERRTSPPSRSRSRRSATATSTMPSAPPTAPTHRRSAWRALFDRRARRLPDAKELEAFSRSRDRPVGRSWRSSAAPRSSDKIPVIENLLDRGRRPVLIGGAMAYTFLRARVRRSARRAVEAERTKTRARMLAQGGASGRALLLPIDHVVATELDRAARGRGRRARSPTAGWALDIGPETVAPMRRRRRARRPFFWNGPMGMLRDRRRLPRARGPSPEPWPTAGAQSIVGGGDCVTAVNKAGFGDRITIICTGGGASLEFLEGDDAAGRGGADRQVIARPIDRTIAKD